MTIETLAMAWIYKKIKWVATDAGGIYYGKKYIWT